MNNLVSDPRKVNPSVNNRDTDEDCVAASGGSGSGPTGSNVVALPPAAPERVTCDMFLRTFTRGVSGRNVVCLADSGAGMQNYEWQDGMQQPASPYFCISTVARPPVLGVDIDAEDEDGNPVPQPKLTRSVLDCQETFVIGLDDIGSKVPADNIPLAPTCRLETSPGNFQYFYLLRKPADPADAGALIEALRLATNPDGSQKYSDKNGIAGVNRVLRVPGSVNTKPSNNGWRAVVREWEPSRVFTLAELAEAFDVTPRPVSVPQHVQGADTDIVLESLQKLGVVLDSHPNARGFYDITCPWAHEHVSDPRPEASYKPSNERGVFHCHHSGCHGRGFSDLCEHLERQDPEFAGKMLAKLTAEKAERNKAVKEMFGVVSEDETANDNTATKPSAKHTFRKRKGTKIVPRKPTLLMSHYAQRGVVTSIVSRPNVGKSQFAVAQACAIATERHDLIGEPKPFLRPGGVIVIGNEDPADIFDKKVDAFLLDNGLSNDDLKHDVQINDRHGFKVVHRCNSLIEITSEMQELGRMILAERATGREDVALVQVDTQGASFQGIEENSNTDMAEAFALLAKWASDHDVALEIIHHTTKDAWNNGSKGIASIRGASAASGSVRIGAELQEPTPGEEDSLPDDQKRTWFKVVITKHAYLPAVEWKDRWFQKKSKLLPTEFEDGTPGPVFSAPVSKFSANGPKLGIDTSDDDIVFRAISALVKREAEQRLPVAATSGNGDRACKLFADALGVDTAAAIKMQSALVRRGLAETRAEPIPGKGKERNVLAPTVAGHKFVKDYKAALDAQGFQPVGTDAEVPSAPEPGSVEAQGADTADTADTAPAEEAEPPSAPVLDFSGCDIDFGEAAA